MKKTITRALGTISLATLAALWLAPGCASPEPDDETEWGGALPGWEVEDGERAMLNGTILVRVVTFIDNGGRGHEELRYDLLKDNDRDSALRLHFDGTPPPLKTGDEVSVIGEVQTKDGLRGMVVEAVIEGSGGIGTAEQSVVTQRQPITHKVAVLLLGTPSTTVDAAKKMLNVNSPGSAASFITESSNSFDKLTSAEVYSYPNFVPGDCNTDAGREKTRTDAINAFKQQHDPSQYQNIIMVIKDAGCTYADADLGTPGSTSVWHSLFSDSQFALCSFVTHELGHNLGFDHAQSMKCSNAVYAANGAGCSTEEYGDVLDVMGGGKLCSGAHYNAALKRYAGYLKGCADVKAGGGATFNLSPMEGSCGTRSLRIPIAGESSYYHLEYRKVGVGEFSGVEGNDRVLLHVANDPISGSPKPYLLDSTPGTTSLRDSWLAVGTTYTLPGSVKIKVVSLGDVAKIEVQMPAGSGATCQDGASPPSASGVLGALCGAVAAISSEAESAPVSSGVVKAATYVNMKADKATIGWDAIAAERYGTYQLAVRYANGSGSQAKLKITVNDQLVGTMSLGPTGSWSTWSAQTINVRLKQGANKLRIRTVSAGPYVDTIKLTYQGLGDLCPNNPNVLAPFNASGFTVGGNTCEDWEGYDCRRAVEDWGYTQAQEDALVASCSFSCGVCP